MRRKQCLCPYGGGGAPLTTASVERSIRRSFPSSLHPTGSLPIKPTRLAALAVTTLFASGAALACGDMKMTDDGDGGHVHGKRVATADTAPAATPTPIDTATVKPKPAAKTQKSQGKPLNAGGATLVKTGS